MDFVGVAWQYLSTELADTPGRFDAMIRTLLACVIVTVTSMALTVPLLSVSLFVIFMVNQENFVKARVTALGIVVTATLGAGLTILILRYTMDNTLIRMLVCAGAVFGCAYIMRVSKVGILFSLVALVVVFGQAAADQMGNGEVLVRACLWAWVAVVYPAFVALAINVWVLPARPDQQFLDEADRQLTMVQDYLAALSEARPWQPGTVPKPSQESSMVLMRLQQACALQDKQSAWAGPSGLVLISARDQLTTTAFEQYCQSVQPARTSPAEHEIIRLCRVELANIQTALKQRQPLRPRHAWGTTLRTQTLTEPLKDIVRALHFLFTPLTMHESPVLLEEEPLFTHDAWVNPSYLYFALKTVLSTYFCYILYSAMNWPGIHTCMLTCIIVAVPGLGASTLKGALRIGGCLLGSILALLATVFLIPQLDSLTGLLLMTVPVLALSAWVTAGSERISYAGLQIMFAFALAVLDHFGPTTDLTEARDRLMGVLLGVTVSAIVNIYFWPDSLREPLRKQAKRLMTAIDALESDSASAQPAADIAVRRLKIWQMITTCERGLSERLMEPGQKISDRSGLTVMAQRWVATAVRAVTLLTNAQWDHQPPGTPSQTLVSDLNLQMDVMTNWPSTAQEASS